MQTIHKFSLGLIAAALLAQPAMAQTYKIGISAGLTG